MGNCRKIFIGCTLSAFILLASYQPVLALDNSDNRSKSLAAYAMGVMYDLYGLTSEAISEFQKASQYNDSYAIRLRLGADYARLGQLSQAIADLQKALEFDPKNVQARYLLALIYSTQRDYDRAAKEYEGILTSFVEAQPENAEIYGYLAQLYYSQKQYDKAILQFEAVLSLDPRNTEVMFLLGALYLEMKDQQKAIELFKRVISLDPEHDSCLNSLGYVYAERGENLDEAQQMIERALTIDPENGAYLDSLGWVYFKKGDYSSALKYLSEAAAVLKEPTVYEHLGDVYHTLNDGEKARHYWGLSLELLPDQERILEKISTVKNVFEQETSSR